MLRKQLRRASAVAFPLIVLLICSVNGSYGQNQTFVSGSTGADGALSYTVPGTYYFDPKSLNPPLNSAGNNIFNFTTINIVSGVTLKLSSRFLTGPVFWLATGAVTIAGILDLNGDNGAAASNQVSRIPAPA